MGLLIYGIFSIPFSFLPLHTLDRETLVSSQIITYFNLFNIFYKYNYFHEIYLKIKRTVLYATALFSLDLLPIFVVCFAVLICVDLS